MPGLSRLVMQVLVVVLSGLTGAANAQDTPTPFSATYHLRLDGWPDADVDHRLSHLSTNDWQSEMRASILTAEGYERGKFRLQEEDVQAWHYASGYSLFGLGERYYLSARDLADLPDRQSALFQLSRKLDDAPCQDDKATPCELAYADHKGRTEHFAYRVAAPQTLEVPAGAFEARWVDGWNPEKPNRRLRLAFSSTTPGLLISVEYYRDGELTSRMVLTELQRDEKR
ncbi:hypothetical protein KZO83_02075 [Chromohalobacter sp. TMW 2.2308]|uniref:hypothetical protein n=1 Tax=Chromohalobacter TaxID=42054 RepID=UPI001FFDBEA2|nr:MULTISPECIES: hypothetical protein [Chromohalobacter]MCK2041479.1 hypothetical protein [Chromohalobacter moromii]MCT8513627.1 hypothetical protein [Chromohalobacter sp. TMW 2.2271]